jgi:hypothetical protein
MIGCGGPVDFTGPPDTVITILFERQGTLEKSALPGVSKNYWEQFASEIGSMTVW